MGLDDLDPLASGEARLELPEGAKAEYIANLDPLASGEARRDNLCICMLSCLFRSTSLRRG